MKEDAIKTVINIRKKQVDHLYRKLYAAIQVYEEFREKLRACKEDIDTTNEKLKVSENSIYVEDAEISGKSVNQWLDEIKGIKIDIEELEKKSTQLTKDLENANNELITIRNFLLKAQAKVDALNDVAKEMQKDIVRKEVRAENAVGDDMYLVKYTTQH